MNSQKQEKQNLLLDANKNISKEAETVVKQIIGDYHTAPSYMKDNEHITHGYRINFDSPKKILRSLFMLHNESVNIWSHFLPAIIICIVIISFALIVDHREMINDMTSYKKDLEQSFDYYAHALDNLTLIENMKNMRDKTQIELQQLRSNAIQSFSSFTSSVNSNIQNINEIMNNQMQGLRQSMRNNVKQSLEKLQIMKKNYENIIAPALVGQLNSLNNTYLNSIKKQVAALKQQFDSDQYNYMDILHETPNPNQVSRWPLMVFLFSAFICLICSTLFHLFYPMSSKSYKIFSRFDYAGISLLIAGSSFPPLYYGMYCYLDVAIIYSIIQMTIAISIFVLSLFQWMHRPQNSSFKAAIYAGFGLANIIPITHLLLNDYLFDIQDDFSFVTSLPYYILLGVSYLIGLYIYTVRCPERHYPGKFNLCGHSHQIWHLFVVLGVVWTYLGALENFEMRKNNTCPVNGI